MPANALISPVLQVPGSGTLGQLYLPAGAPVALPAGRHPLGIIDHSGDGNEGIPHKDVPIASIAMNAIEGSNSQDVWYTDQPVHYETTGEIRYAQSGSLLFGVAHYPADDIDKTAYQAYCNLIRLTRATGAGKLIRLWNYFPGINEDQADLERYRRFCRGRHEALADMGYSLDRDLPAATAVGSRQGDFWVIFLAGNGDSLQVENPLQTSAFRYPPDYGPRSPAFSRAVRYSAGQGDQLFVSGTASIRGHETLHPSDLVGQCAITLSNLSTLVEQAGEGHLRQLGARARWKVYLRHAEDFQTLRDCLGHTLDPTSPILHVAGDICRQSLLFEIEGLIDLQSFSMKC